MRLPQELVEDVVDCLSDDRKMLESCSLVATTWLANLNITSSTELPEQRKGHKIIFCNPSWHRAIGGEVFGYLPIHNPDLYDNDPPSRISRTAPLIHGFLNLLFFDSTGPANLVYLNLQLQFLARSSAEQLG